MDKFLQLLVSGIALGAIYALIALGFVVIYKATATFNFAQGGFVLLGAYLTYQFALVWELDFYLAMVAAMAVMAAIAAVLERLVLRRLIGQPDFTITLVTIGILLVIQQAVPTIWDQPGISLTNPWTDQATDVGGVTVSHANFWTVVFAGVILALFVCFFRFTRLGLGMRAVAVDQEAAAAQGLDVGRVFQASWAIAGAVAVVAGVMLTARQGDALTVGVSFVALRAFPAMILGGLDSASGAVLGGVAIGVAEVMSAGYLDYEALGAGVEVIVPYVVLILVLLWRPSGLFGTRTVVRV